MGTFPSPFGGSDDDDDGGGLFDAYDEFVPAHLPDPGPFLDGHDAFTDDEHIAFHKVTKKFFEERGVYDMTFNYNLARLNLDTRHPEAGYRYAEESGNPGVLRAEFTPTTPFCPQTHTLTKGSFRAWNAERDRHAYELVKVRAAPMHHQSEPINEQLAELEEKFQETGDVTVVASDSPRVGSNPMERSMKEEGSSRGSKRSPF